MTTDVNNILFLVLNFKLKENKEWIIEDGLFPQIINLILGQDIVPLHFYSLEENHLIPVNRKEIIEKYISTEEGDTRSLEIYREQSDEPFDDGITFSKSSFYGDEFTIKLSLNSYDAETNVLKLQRFIWDTLELLKKDCYLEYGYINIMSTNVEYPEPRPVRSFGGFVKRGIFNIFDHEYFDKYPDKLAGIKKYQVDELVTALDTKGHPYQVGKKDDRFTMVTWSDTLKVDKLSDILSKREDFFYEHVSLPLDNYFNEEGDRRMLSINNFINLPEEPFFTYYYPRYRAAFKAYTGASETELDPDTAKELKSYAESKILKDGREINQIMLIVTTRKLALSLEKHAKSVGVSKLYYVDNDRALWDIYPRGNWKN